MDPACPFGLNPLVFGTGCCLVAALGYTAVDVGVRSLLERQSLIWILFVKELVAVVLVGPWLLRQARREEGGYPWGQTLLELAVVGILTHLAGNVPLFWAMSVVGLAITVPASLGVNLIGSAALGWFFLRERVSSQSALAIAAVVASVVFLSLGAERASRSVVSGDVEAPGAFGIGFAVALACLAGLVFSMLSLTIRRSAMRGVPLSWLAFVIPATGVITLGPLCVWQHGLASLMATPLPDFLLMVLCGVLNLIAFVSIIKGLQMTSMVHANVLSASQVAMAAAAGFLFFQEAASSSLVAGVCLTVAGMVLMDRTVAA
jgi:drug/metabolite transporter, DME family